ncbi:MAG: 50S ribosomal protein L21 [Melioribacteraceae bacterium]|nr:50S ribosomal protein L21 [Melioribacteraceae bacterium]MCF8353109.1 50S ribosomal protein L21 [Melioribacteraceae bacterium]MCF8392745.1 50S ribosomal protein L21 [Melioribacteraceae bacterium]MCF8418276.1 50S ribosomal protein L21 [Melioribacteraceae bacterium]
MFAVVDIAGQQFKVEKNGHYYVPKLSQEVDSEVKFESVLLLSDSKKTQVGAPNLDGVSVTAKVLEHTKDDKVIVFKKKRRKSYRKFKGHRQQLTKIEVTSIG